MRVPHSRWFARVVRGAWLALMVPAAALLPACTSGPSDSFAAAPRVAARHTRATAAGFITNGYTQTTVADFDADTKVDVQADGTIGDGAVTLANARSVSVLVVGEKRPNPTDNPDNRGHIYKFPSGAPGTTQNLDDDFASISFLPKTMAVGSDGLVYFPETDQFSTAFPQEVTVWDPTDGAQGSNFSSGATIRAAMGDSSKKIRVVRADDASHLYFSPVPGASNPCVAQFDISTQNSLVNYCAPGQGIEEIRDVAIGGDGRVFAAAKFKPGAVSQEGILYWNADGTFVGSFGTGDLDVAQSLGIDRVNNELYVLNPLSAGARSNRVEVFNVGLGTPVFSRQVLLTAQGGADSGVNRLTFRFGKLYGSRETDSNQATRSFQFEPNGTRNVIYQATVPSLIPTMYDIDAVAGPPGSDFVESGTLTSTAITKPAFAHWQTIDFNTNTPPNTTLTIDVLDADTGDLLVGNVVSGAILNDLLDSAPGGVAELCRSTIKLRANFTTGDITVSPELLDWTVRWTDDDPALADCNSNDLPDSCDLAGSTSSDCNSNNVPDSCDIAGTTSTDCNVNQVPDDCDIAGSTSTDCGGSGQAGIPDGIPDGCPGQGVVCDDGEACTSDICTNGAAGPGTCDFQPIADGEGCEDGDACTTGETCASGLCEGGVAVICDNEDFCDGVETCDSLDFDGDPCQPGSDPCTDPALPQCDENANECVECLIAGDCDDGNICTDDDCVGGSCVNDPNSINCDDGDACTTSDACSNGACLGGPPLNCDDDNVCTDDTCDPGSGCVNTPNTGGCDNDNDPCTDPDTCSNGVCVVGPFCSDPTPVCNAGVGCVECLDASDCDDELFCNGEESCNASLECVSPGDPCTPQLCDETSNGCFGCVSDQECDDGDPCTDDSCNTETGDCELAPNSGNSCEDGSLCTAGDMCSNGVCIGGGFPCDIGEACDPDTGCGPDCNTNGIVDELDIGGATSNDCDGNTTPDDCQLASNDCNNDGTPDTECQLEGHDCNANNTLDECDISGGAADCQSNGVPDSCEIITASKLLGTTGADGRWLKLDKTDGMVIPPPANPDETYGPLLDVVFDKLTRRIYGSTGGTKPAIVLVDARTGAQSLVGFHGGGEIHALVFVGAQLWGAESVGNSDSRMVRIDPENGALTVPEAHNGATTGLAMGGLAWTGTELVGVVRGSFVGGQFVKVDLADGTAAVLGDTGFLDVSALTIDPSDDRLYAATGPDAVLGGLLFTIDPVSGDGTPVGLNSPDPPPPLQLDGLVFTVISDTNNNGVPDECDVPAPPGGDDGGCTADTDCTTNQVCDTGIGQCVAAPECTANADCVDDGVFCNGSEICNDDGECDHDGDPCGAQLCDEDGDECVGCLGDANCDDGEVCDPDSNECVVIPAAGGCAGDTDCGVDEVCNTTTGQCVPEPECTSGDDCADGQICDVAIGECVPAPAAGCANDADCDPGEKCDTTSGACVPQSAPGGPPIPDEVVVSGETTVPAGSSTGYQAFLRFPDGSQQDVTRSGLTNWRVEVLGSSGVLFGLVAIDFNGLLTVPANLTGDETVAVVAEYRDGDLTLRGELPVTLVAATEEPAGQDGDGGGTSTGTGRSSGTFPLCSLFGSIGLPMVLASLLALRLATRRRRWL